MSEHTFKPGDIVRALSRAGVDGPELEVVGEQDAYPGMLICRAVGNDRVRLPYWPATLTLVRAPAAAAAGGEKS